MARSRTFLRLELPVADVHPICVAAIVGMGWRSSSEGPRRITAQEPAEDAIDGVNPIRITVCLESVRDIATQSTVNGANFGCDALAAAHVRDGVARLVAAMGVGEVRAIFATADGRNGARHNLEINGRRMPGPLIAAFEREYGTSIPDGAYWYDAVCGAWGLQHGPIRGYVQPGLDLGGPLLADASGGTSGVVINGRELSFDDIDGLCHDLDVRPGRYWLNDRGEFGHEQGRRIAVLPLVKRGRFPVFPVGRAAFKGTGGLPSIAASRPEACKPAEIVKSKPPPGADTEPKVRTAAA